VYFLGVGREETGTAGWFRFFGVGVQPSELVKVAFIITFSVHLDAVRDEINAPRNALLLLLHFAGLAVLVVLQNDTGTALVFVCIFLGMIFSAGLSWKYIAAAFGALCVAAPVAWFGFMHGYQQKRILVFLNPEMDMVGDGYQASQSKIAVGSGELFGRGFLQGTQNQLELLPAKHTDFIFGVAGEEFGFAGCLIVLALLAAIIARCLYVARRAKNPMGRYLCVGVASMLSFHMFENIGMCIGLMPITGIPLPFVSYGGSSLITNLIAIGLVLSVWRSRQTLNFGGG
jgi:rod shape determining protein RodA